MKRSCFAVFLLVAALSLVASSLPVCGAERQPAWGWKAEEGAGPPPKHPRPAPAANSDAWRAKVAEPDHKVPKPEPQVKAAPAGEASATAKSYCENIADPALDARFLSQKAELTRLEEELTKRTSLLEAKRVELQGWLKRRDDFVSKAEGSLVALYSKIKPDAAAPLLAAMDEEAAAALLLKLSAKTSSAILDEMETGKAARLVSVMIGAAKPEDKASAQKASSDQAKEGQKEAGQPETAGKRS